MQNAEALKNEGNARRSAGDLQGALESYRRALEVDPDYSPAIYNLGVVLHDFGRLGEAEQCFRRFHALDPSDRDGAFRLGLVLAEQERNAEAAEAFRVALRVDAANPLLWLELGKAYRALHRGGEATECASRALAIEPALAEGYNLMGMLLQDEGSTERAIEQYRKAAALGPGEPAYHNNLGCALGLTGALDESVASLRRAVELRPEYVEAHANVASLYALQGRHDLAAASLEAAHKLAPGEPALTADLCFELRQLCDWSRLDSLIAAQRRDTGKTTQQPPAPFTLLSIPSTRAEQLACARNHAQKLAQAVSADRTRLAFAFERMEKPRLRIGYLSSDLHDHATAHLTAELFELHDRGRFEVIAYSYGPDDGSPMRARLLRAFDRFVEIGRATHVEAARAIHADRIDILVDLKGYTTNARAEIMALGPAPIQVSYLGYPGTMGAEFVHYLVSDRIVTPPEHAGEYSEKLVTLPGCYQVNDRKRFAGPPPKRSELGLPEQATVFFCFNQAYKILPETFSSWMSVLAQVPGSVLWLLDLNPAAVRNLRREAAQRGVDPARLVFAPLLPHDRHLSRLAAADLLLDTAPYNAHTTASDALWAGIPVVTCVGDTFVARVAASQLTAVGMAELIAGSTAEYEAIAVRLGRNASERVGLRERLARSRAESPLFDAPGFTRSLEAGFEHMWDHYVAGRAPRAIEVG